VKLAIATPFYGSQAFVQYVESLLLSCRVLDKFGVEWDYWTIHNDSYIDRAKNSIADRFYKSDCTDLLMIDSDISWDVQGLLYLINSPFELTGGMFPMKGAWDKYAGKIKVDEKGAPVQEEKTGLIEAEYLPGGFLRIRKSCIDKLTKAYQNNWYYDDATGNKIVNLFEMSTIDNVKYGEDGGFCRKWTAMGGKCYVEPRISFGHTGSNTFTGNFHEYLLRSAETERIRVAIEGAKA
jgi:hypothetical protein